MAKDYKLVGGDMVWYKKLGTRISVRKRKKKTCVDFEFYLPKTTTARRPDLTLEDKAKKEIWICNMAYPQQWKIEAKR